MWSRFKNWHCVLPPNRPTVQNLNLVKSVVASETDPKVLVLGSTVEYRAMLSSLGSNVTIVDKHREFYDYTQEFVVSNERESMIEADWLDFLDGSQVKFDIILSHFTRGNVPFEYQADFHKLLAASTNPSGIIVDRLLHYRSGLSTPEEIRARFKVNHATIWEANDLNCYGIFRNPMIAEIGSIDASQFYEFLDSMGGQIKSLANIAREFVTPTDAVWDYDGTYWDPYDI
jgi:hypothetical protein